jgi:hypothetical protein
MMGHDVGLLLNLRIWAIRMPCLEDSVIILHKLLVWAHRSTELFITYLRHTDGDLRAHDVAHSRGLDSHGCLKFLRRFLPCLDLG